MKLDTSGVTPEIVVTPSRHVPGAEVIEIPGLGYWSSRESAQNALDKLASGICPMSHQIEAGFEPKKCSICGRMEQTIEASENDD
jgi:hypothetical protein